MYYGPDVFDIDQPLNKQWRFSHEEGCRSYGEGPDYRERLYVRRTTNGWLYYCHNCGAAGMRPYNSRELLTTVLRHADERSSTELLEEKAYDLHFTSFSRIALDWLYKYDIKDNEISTFGIKYTDEFGGRIAIPVHNNKEHIIGYQLRKLEGKGAKYITRIQGVQSGTAAFRALAPAEMGARSRIGVAVEDALSAIRVRRMGISALALLGSPKRVPQPLALELEARFDTTAFWLDPDKSDRGREMAEQMARLYSGKYLFILGDRDPKEYSDAELRQILGHTFSLDF